MRNYFHYNLDQCLYPPLKQQQSTDNKLGLMLGQGRGRCEIAQIWTLIQ